MGGCIPIEITAATPPVLPHSCHAGHGPPSAWTRPCTALRNSSLTTSESFIWQQASLALRPACEPQSTTHELWQRVCEGKISPYDCLWHVKYETSSVGNRNAVDGSVLGGCALPFHLARQVESFFPYQFGHDISGTVHNATKHINRSTHEFRGAEKN